jgi:hypothetical protein
MSRGSIRAIAVAAALAVFAMGALAFSLHSGNTGDIRGVRLGLSASDTRDRFVAPGPGTWTSAAEPEPVLRWAPDDAASPVHAATFHQGMLVAIRLRVAPGAHEAAGPPLELSRSSLTSRGAEPGGDVAVTQLSRSCPTHADEVRRLLSADGK